MVLRIKLPQVLRQALTDVTPPERVDQLDWDGIMSVLESGLPDAIGHVQTACTGAFAIEENRLAEVRRKPAKLRQERSSSTMQVGLPDERAIGP